MLIPGVNAQTPPVSLKGCSPETVTREALVEGMNGLSPVLGAERRMRTRKGGIRNSHTQGRGEGVPPSRGSLRPYCLDVYDAQCVQGWRASQGALVVKNLPANAGGIRDMGSIFLGQEDPLEEAMATHSNILA